MMMEELNKKKINFLNVVNKTPPNTHIKLAATLHDSESYSNINGRS